VSPPTAEGVRLPGSGGVQLVADTWGSPGAPPVVLLHGGGQTRGSWSGAGPELAAAGWHVLAVDGRGHGDSDWSPDGLYDLDRFAADVEALARSLPAPPVFVGASLGGMSALLAVGERGAPARAVVLVDVAHRAEDEGIQQIVDFMTGRPEGFASVDEAAAAVSAYLPHRPRPRATEGLLRNLRRRGDRWVWHWDPRFLDGMHELRERARPERHLAAARAAGVPVLLVRGGASDVLSEEIADEFVAAVPGAQRADVPAAGHMIAGDRNDRFVGAIRPFLDAL
jgi:peroxiredoxin